MPFIAERVTLRSIRDHDGSNDLTNRYMHLILEDGIKVEPSLLPRQYEIILAVPARIMAFNCPNANPPRSVVFESEVGDRKTREEFVNTCSGKMGDDYMDCKWTRILVEFPPTNNMKERFHFNLELVPWDRVRLFPHAQLLTSIADMALESGVFSFDCKDGKVVTVNSGIAIAASKFLMSRFESPCADANSFRLSLEDYDEATVKTVKKIMTTGKFDVSDLDVSVVMLLNFLDVQGFENIWPFLCDCIAVDNCLRIMDAASKCGDKCTLKVAEYFLRDNLRHFVVKDHGALISALEPIAS